MGLRVEGFEMHVKRALGARGLDLVLRERRA
jgi:hypothetical protein